MRCEMQAERWEGLGRWRRKRHVEESARLKAVATRARAERTLNMARNAAHVRDAGRVEAQRLVERQRALPSRKEGVRCGAKCGPGGGRTRGAAAVQAACMERARLKAVGARARAERTPNM